MSDYYEDNLGPLISGEYPLCGQCHGEMVQLTGYLTFYCPWCSSEKECIESVLKDICAEDTEAAQILKELMK